MTADKLIAKVKYIATLDTQYLQGGYGCRLWVPDWYNTEYAWNSQNASKINAHKKPYFYGFDCVCLLKSALFFNFTGDPSKPYGGSVYTKNKDITIEAFKQSCGNTLSTDFTVDPQPGELLFIGNGHIGLYIGNGEVIEATPAWKCNVQRTLLPSRNSTNYEHLPVRKWDAHGRSSYIEYTDTTSKLLDENARLKAALLEIKEVVNNVV